MSESKHEQNNYQCYNPRQFKFLMFLSGLLSLAYLLGMIIKL